MQQNPSDPARNPQFRRNWGGAAVAIKFLAEMSERDLDFIALRRGEDILRRLPAALTIDLRPEERRDLARSFGRPWLRRFQEQRAVQRPQPLNRRGRWRRC